MTIQINQPELEAMIEHQLNHGAFQDIDELLLQALNALRDQTEAKAASEPRRRLIDVLTRPPFAGSGLVIERQRDVPPPIDL